MQLKNSPLSVNEEQKQHVGLQEEANMLTSSKKDFKKSLILLMSSAKLLFLKQELLSDLRQDYSHKHDVNFSFFSAAF